MHRYTNTDTHAKDGYDPAMIILRFFMRFQKWTWKCVINLNNLQTLKNLSFCDCIKGKNDVLKCISLPLVMIAQKEHENIIWSFCNYLVRIHCFVSLKQLKLFPSFTKTICNKKSVDTFGNPSYISFTRIMWKWKQYNWIQKQSQTHKKKEDKSIKNQLTNGKKSIDRCIYGFIKTNPKNSSKTSVNIHMCMWVYGREFEAQI